jgi:hypothetical protein
MYLTQLLTQSYFPPNQEQFLYMQCPVVASNPQRSTSHQPTGMTSASEDEEDSERMAQDITWQIVKVTKRKKKNI